MTPEENLAPAVIAEESRKGLSPVSEDWTSLRLHEWVPKVPVIIQRNPSTQ